MIALKVTKCDRMIVWLPVILLFLTAKLVPRTECNGKLNDELCLYYDNYRVILFIVDECCYLYGSVPYNGTNCVPEGGQITLNYIIYNPHDNFTNLTVTWFRSETEDTSSYEMLPTVTAPQEYTIKFFKAIEVSLAETELMSNCSLDVYRDKFSLVILNFTSNKNGHYWCQLAINNTYVQRSHHALFYAGEPDSTTCSRPPTFQYFTPAVGNQNQCARYHMNTITSQTDSTTLALSSVSESSSIESSTTSYPMNIPLTTTIYVTGILSALVLLFGALVIILSTLYLCKVWKRKTSKS